MTMVNKSHRVLTLFLAIFMMFSLVAPMSVFAVTAMKTTGSNVEKIARGSLPEPTIKSAMGKANARAGQTNDQAYAKEDGGASALVVEIEGLEYEFMTILGDTVYVDKKVWKDAGNATIADVYQEFVDALIEVEADPDAVQSFMDSFGAADSSLGTTMLLITFNAVQPDLYKAYKIMEPFLNILNVVLGIGCVVLILILMGSTVMDLAYIGLPVWREAQDSKGKKNPFGVSYEALRTVQEVEKGLGGGDGEYRNAYMLYFKRRALTYIILALCIMYLICGGLTGIIGFVLSLVGGITG